MRIQKQLGIGFLCVVGVSGLSAGIAFASQRVHQVASEAVAQEAALYDHAAQLERALASLAEGAEAVVRHEGALGMQWIAEGQAELATGLSALERLRLDVAMAAELDDLKVLAGGVLAANAGVLSAFRAQPEEKAPARLERALDVLRTRRRALTVKVQLFVDHARERAQTSRLEARRAWERATLCTFGLLVVALLVAVVFSVRLARRLAHPIEQLAETARRIGAGDLGARTGIRRPDELGDLAGVFDQMTHDLQQAQARLIEAERLDAIGELAVTMKHELNNPLAGISGALCVVLDDAACLPEPTREALHLVKEATERMSALVTRLDRICAPVTKPYLGDVRMLDLKRSAP